MNNEPMNLEGETPLEKELREASEYAELHRDDDISGWPEVKVRVAKNLRQVYSLRIGADELDEIAEAAEAAGQNVSEFIRGAALAHARRQKLDKSPIDEVREKARELSEAVSRL